MSKISVNVDEKGENPFISAHQIFEKQDVSPDFLERRIKIKSYQPF